jgi:molybdopterin/thiamine biosynthesis adenylyltransferase
LTLLDHDEVELSNLARQLFGPEDLGKNKARPWRATWPARPPGAP